MDHFEILIRIPYPHYISCGSTDIQYHIKKSGWPNSHKRVTKYLPALSIDNWLNLFHNHITSHYSTIHESTDINE